eukprot:TRINITY_DN97790_c0_g1_i1.p1 TRINITY_DN97790_c0_g1~~TRINITY_DN97790_c0_g1_i1.p1  ORF type:complete len:180 (-),score=14.76 TRINITY_DN97790_c0_g1_i1:6-545(-)
MLQFRARILSFGIKRCRYYASDHDGTGGLPRDCKLSSEEQVAHLKQQSTKGLDTLFISNISYHIADNELQQTCEAHGVVKSSKVIRDAHSGRSKGFAYVTFSTPEEAQHAVKMLNGLQLGNEGRRIRVHLAHVSEVDRVRSGEQGKDGIFNPNREKIPLDFKLWAYHIRPNFNPSPFRT